jgi:amidophosphoribosyltransferase
MPTAQELIAHGLTTEEVCTAIGADWLIYQDLDDLIYASSEGNPEIKTFDCAVFDGKYVTDDVDQDYLDQLAAKRNEKAQTKQRELDLDNSNVVGIHNDSAEN